MQLGRLIVVDYRCASGTEVRAYYVLRSITRLDCVQSNASAYFIASRSVRFAINGQDVWCKDEQ